MTDLTIRLAELKADMDDVRVVWDLDDDGPLIGSRSEIAALREQVLALIAAVEGVMAIVGEHARREAHNEMVPLNRISDLLPEPTSEEYRRAITEALGVRDDRA